MHVVAMLLSCLLVVGTTARIFPLVFDVEAGIRRVRRGMDQLDGVGREAVIKPPRDIVHPA